MKRFIFALAVMAMTLSASAQTKKTTSTKKTTTTASAKKTTTTKSGTATKKTTATSKTTSTAGKKPATTTTKKPATTAKKPATTTAKPATTTPAQTTQPAATVQQHREVAPAPHQQASKTPEHKAQKSYTSHENKGWNEVYHYLGASFIHASESTSYKESNKEREYSCTGTAFKFTTGYNRAFPLSQSIPLYLRAGGSFTYEVGTKDFSDMYGKPDGGYKAKTRADEHVGDDMSITAYMFSTNINVDCGYKIPIADGKMQLMPYAGADLKINLAGGATESDYSMNLFKKEDLDLDGKTLNRIQGGFHIGADVYAIRHLVVGMAFQYYTPLLNISESHEHSDNQFKLSQCSLVLKAGFVW